MPSEFRSWEWLIPTDEDDEMSARSPRDRFIPCLGSLRRVRRRSFPGRDARGPSRGVLAWPSVHTGAARFVCRS